MPSTSEFTIIGSGVNGLLTARELVSTGATVTIFEKNQLGQESSWAGGGILLPLYPWRQDQAITELVKQSIKLYPSLNEELLQKTGINPEWIASGMLITKNPDIQQAESWCQNNNIPCYPGTVEQLSPFHTESLNPLWLPSIAQARNPRLLKALIQDLKSKKVIFKENSSLQEVQISKNHIHSIITSGEKSSVNHLILTTGAWTSELWQVLFGSMKTNSPDIFPVKGQMLLFDAKPDTLSHMILDGDRYLIPRRDGKILAGSTVEKHGFNKEITANAKQQLSEFAINLFPALADFPIIDHWAGIRPGTRHGVPYIDKHPEIDNLSINAGHFRNGLVMAPASAQLLTNLILRQPTTIDPAPYQL
jgi:glycine oxidase